MVQPDDLQALIRAEGLPDSYTAIADRWWRPLARRIAGRHRAVGRPILVGINGAQGSGKSTMTLFLERMLCADFGLRVATLSLDDLYLTLRQRRRIAADVHPLLATRGVPGTHEVALGLDVIARALGGRGSLLLPRFDKSTDDRAAPERWPVVTTPLDILLFEGWCMAAQPVPPEQLALPINSLEAAEDPDGRWRAYVNAQLAGPYRALFDPLDLTIMLRAPSFDQVAEWRTLQESKLIQRTGKGMDAATLARFLMHYERLTRQMLATLPPLMDVVFEIGAGHDPVGATGLDG